MLDGKAAAILDALLEALREGASKVELASAVAFAAATRIARLPTSNEFGDWDTALHTFTFANAVEQACDGHPRRSCCAACSTPRSASTSTASSMFPPRGCRRPSLPPTQVHSSTNCPVSSTDSSRSTRPGSSSPRSWPPGGQPGRLVAALAAALVGENRNFHTIQCVEAALRQHDLLAGSGDEALPLLAAAGYLAAHATTTRSQHQTFEIARRLHRGEKLYEGEAA